MNKHIKKVISFIILTIFIGNILSFDSNIAISSVAYALGNFSKSEQDYIVVNNKDELFDKVTEELYKKSTLIKVKQLNECDDVISMLNDIVYKDDYLACAVSSINTEYSIYSNPSYILYTFEVEYLTTTKQDKEIDDKIKEILEVIITSDMYTYQKVKAVNDYIVINYQYDTTLKNYSDYDLLLNGESVCTGYALLTYKMLKALNIPVCLVRGEAFTDDSFQGTGHVWNMVNIGGYWYNLDTTWNDPLPDRGNNISYDYYLKSDQQFNVDHVPDNNSNKPATSKSYDTYLYDFNTNIDKLITKPTTDNINIIIHDSYIDFKEYDIKPVEPFISKGRTLVPLRAVFSKLGYTVEWDNKTRTATISGNNNILTIRPNDMYATINNKKVYLDVPAKLINDRIVVPVRFISEAFGNIVLWDNKNKTVLIY